ncbi:MAG: hypothetical protein V2I43_18275, partial [Parvularcula sp.]|nr:hypothetical protein [Parvularcula sp.]
LGDLQKVTDSHPQPGLSDIDRVISLTETALAMCDDSGWVFPAIDICSALEKLRALKDQQEGQ